MIRPSFFCLLEQKALCPHSLQFARTVFVRVVQFEVRPKVRVRKLSRIATNLISAVRSSVKVRQTFKSSSNF